MASMPISGNFAADSRARLENLGNSIGSRPTGDAQSIGSMDHYLNTPGSLITGSFQQFSAGNQAIAGGFASLARRGGVFGMSASVAGNVLFKGMKLFAKNMQGIMKELAKKADGKYFKGLGFLEPPKISQMKSSIQDMKPAKAHAPAASGKGGKAKFDPGEKAVKAADKKLKNDKKIGHEPYRKKIIEKAKEKAAEAPGNKAAKKRAFNDFISRVPTYGTGFDSWYAKNILGADAATAGRMGSAFGGRVTTTPHAEISPVGKKMVGGRTLVEYKVDNKVGSVGSKISGDRVYYDVQKNKWYKDAAGTQGIRPARFNKEFGRLEFSTRDFKYRAGKPKESVPVMEGWLKRKKGSEDRNKAALKYGSQGFASLESTFFKAKTPGTRDPDMKVVDGKVVIEGRGTVERAQRGSFYQYLLWCERNGVEVEVNGTIVARPRRANIERLMR